MTPIAAALPSKATLQLSTFCNQLMHFEVIINSEQNAKLQFAKALPNSKPAGNLKLCQTVSLGEAQADLSSPIKAQEGDTATAPAL